MAVSMRETTQRTARLVVKKKKKANWGRKKFGARIQEKPGCV
jgi:hypothetical protein